ncbi:hypothetical protein ZIOFF_013954 [Zingiber officinale]|uniref:Uncharacterized protein n=1 Tax=Zingiber officinale TaxID=94328 RepID=A0A8J5HP32_ZINOF|nr:hypothetical protein ZIOFF_013954 [Zingiber officinale]
MPLNLIFQRLSSTLLALMIQVVINPDSPFRELEIKSRGAMITPVADVVMAATIDELLHTMQAACGSFPSERVQHVLPQLHEQHAIRWSSYHDVIRVLKIQKVLNITSVQTYIINNTNLFFFPLFSPPPPHSPTV